MALASLARLGVPGPLGHFAQDREARELAPMALVDGGLVMRCSRAGPRSEVVGWWTSFGAVGRKKFTREACPQWRGSVVGKRHRQFRVGVTGWVRAVGEILGGVVLGV
jgi:hypothetical protein